MALRLVCTCGYVIGGANRDFSQDVQNHMGLLHPELVDNLTRDDIFAKAWTL